MIFEIYIMYTKKLFPESFRLLKLLQTILYRPSNLELFAEKKTDLRMGILCMCRILLREMSSEDFCFDTDK